MRKFLASLLVFGALSGAAVMGQDDPAAPAGPSDITGTPREEAIRAAIDEGWFQGYPDGTFRPWVKITSGQAGKALVRAYPDGITRADAAALIVEGRRALVPPEPGRLLPAETPVVSIRNMPGVLNNVELCRWVGVGTPSHRWVCQTVVETCHIDQEHPDHSTRTNLKSWCGDQAKRWVAEWKFLPKDFDASNLFVYSLVDGERRRVHFVERAGSRNTSIGKAETLLPLEVRDVPGRLVDVLIECVQYEAWSETPVKKAEDIPYRDCLQPEPEDDEGAGQ